jgi:integrase
MSVKIITVLNNVELPIYHINNKFKMKLFNKFPFASYSTGIPCYLINLYLQSNDNINLSYTSILKKSYALSLLIKFSEDNNLDFKNFNSSSLFLFSKSLEEELNKNDPSKKSRSNNSINSILKTSLYFFDFLGRKILNQPDFCIEILQAELKKNVISIEERGTIERYGWYHKSFVRADSKKKRTPISQNCIDRLYEEIPNLSESRHVQYRTSIMLKILDITGARAGEVSRLRINDIVEAYNQESPLLKMETLKRRGGNETRYVPVEKIDLKEVMTFIKIYRSKIIRKTIGKEKDHGFLFLNENTGNNILSATISNEMNKLKKLAGIQEQTCAHMFRHRYITKFFVKLIKQYDFENQDDFRNALLDINSLKVYIQQATGHKDVRSLDHYIDLAKAEITNIDKVIEKVNNVSGEESIIREEKRLLNQLKEGLISVDKYVVELENIRK